MALSLKSAPARECLRRALSKENSLNEKGEMVKGLNDQPPAKSWNSSHPSRGEGGGCSQAALRGAGGAGLFYCFATN